MWRKRKEEWAGRGEKTRYLRRYLFLKMNSSYESEDYLITAVPLNQIINQGTSKNLFDLKNNKKNYTVMQ